MSFAGTTRAEPIREMANCEHSTISIIIPVFNEAERIASTIRTVSRYAAEAFAAHEIIVIDDGSTDRTVPIVQALAASVPGVRLFTHRANRGKGACIKTGILSSNYDLVYMCDADLATPIAELEKYVARMEQGYDIVIGSRTSEGAEIVIPQPWYRKLMGKAFNRAVQVIVLKGIADTQCGFKLFRRYAARRIAVRSRIDHFSFDVELLFLARMMGFTVSEVPVRWINNPDSSVRIIVDSLVMLRDLLRIRLNHLRGRYAG